MHTSVGRVVAARRRLVIAAAALTLVAIAVLSNPWSGASSLGTARADAAAYTIAVYPPSRLNASQLRGWAKLSRDCSGTYGCSNYIKIERQRAWGVQFVGGWWATANGWNSITAGLPRGCFDYRTTVDSYNDVAGSSGGGVNVGPVGVSSNGTKIYRYRNTWSSGFSRICR